VYRIATVREAVQKFYTLAVSVTTCNMFGNLVTHVRSGHAVYTGRRPRPRGPTPNVMTRVVTPSFR
jgi:hypothetical protein